MIDMMTCGRIRYGARGQWGRIMGRVEEATGLRIRAPGFQQELVDDEHEDRGYGVVVRR